MAIDKDEIGAIVEELSRLHLRQRLFAILVLASHLFQIEPSKLDAGGVRIVIEDAIVVRGGVAILFLYYSWRLALNVFATRLVLPFPRPHDLVHVLMRYARKPYRDIETSKRKLRTPEAAKRWVRRTLWAYRLGAVPVVLLIIGMIGLALVLSIPDAWLFIRYIWAKDWA